MLKSDRLVCEKNATIAQSVTNYNLDPSILIMKQIYRSCEILQQFRPSYNSEGEVLIITVHQK